MEYTEEQLNYYRICYVTTDLLTEGLRTIFKQEWDNRYTTTLGEWKDEPRNGMDFYNGESPRNQKRNAHLLATMVKGDRAEWDCTMLFYAILYSDCISSYLNPVVKLNVNDLRKFRNEGFAIMPKGHISDHDFQNAISRVHAAFQGLGLSTLQIEDIRNQTAFPTGELRNIMEKVDKLKQELLEKEEQRQVLEDQLLNEISSFCILPPKPSHHIAGRTQEVAEITEQLKQLKNANKNNLSYLYISGNPGSGKSQLASLAANRFFDEVKEIPCATSFVMTLNAESLDTLLESYINFARHLKCPEYAVTNTLSSKDLTADEKITNLKTLISTKIELYSSWLLLVDNVTSLSSVQVHLPQRGRGQFLITTWDTTSIPLRSSSIEHISLSKGMEPRDASSLLAMLSGISDTEMEEQVARALDYQPLALASAATYLREVRKCKITSQFGWKDYLMKLAKGQQRTTETLLAETNPSYSKTMTTVIAQAIKNMVTSDKVVSHMFNFLSVCAPQPLYLDIVINYILNVEEEIKDREMISVRIQRCPLLLLEEKESSIYIRLHQIVYDVVTETVGDHLNTIGEAVRAFNQFIDKSPAECSSDIVPHLQTLVSTIGNLSCKSQFEKTLFSSVPQYFFKKLGKICEKHGQWSFALKYYQIALQLTSDNLDVAENKSLTANVHFILGDLLQARDCYENALTIRLKALGPQHVDVATTFNALGSLHRELGDLQQAKKHYERALAIELSNLGTQHVSVANSYNNLGAVCRNLGDLVKAKEYHECALDICLRTLGPEHADVATTYNNLAVVSRALGNLQQAKKYHERALSTRLKKLGPDHVNVATSYNDLGLVLCELGDLEQSKELYDRALSIYQKRLAPEHIYVATTLSNLGSVHHKMGDLQQAKLHYERAHDYYLKKLGPENVCVANSWNALAGLYREMGNLQQAKVHYERALDIHLKVLGPEHTDVGNSFENLGFVHREMGEFQQAKECYEHALAIRVEKLGSDHVGVAAVHNSLGLVLHNLGDLQNAKLHYERALTGYIRLNDEHADIAFLYNNLGLLYRALGDLQQAKAFHERALAIRLKTLGADHVQVATTYNDLGLLYSELGDLQKAGLYYNYALSIYLEKLGPDHLYVAHTSTNLGFVHSKMGNLKQAKESHERALACYLKTLGPEHVCVSSSYNDLARVNQELGHLQKAKYYCDQALASSGKKL